MPLSMASPAGLRHKIPVSQYAANNIYEFAAEVLSWYMNPEYGKSVPAMPDYLENWVRECFPMLDTESW